MNYEEKLISNLEKGVYKYRDYNITDFELKEVCGRKFLLITTDAQSFVKNGELPPAKKYFISKNTYEEIYNEMEQKQKENINERIIY